MKIRRIYAQQFRNLESCELEPGDGINLFIGLNGQGKTSILEALGYLSSLRSFRTAQSLQMMRFGQHRSRIECEIEGQSDRQQNWQSQLAVEFNRKSQATSRVERSALINGKIQRSLSHYLERRLSDFGSGFHSVVFNPEDHELVRGEPKTRRNYLDQVITAENLDYLISRKKFQRVLDQKSKLLKTLEFGTPFARIQPLVEPLNHQLVEYGADVLWHRLEWLERLKNRFEHRLKTIAPNQAQVRIVYFNDTLSELGFKEWKVSGESPIPRQNELKEAMSQQLLRLAQNEFFSQRCLIGPQRDDWQFYQGLGTLKAHGSQGEIRSVLLALKLLEIDLYRDQTGLKPVFLLDDFSSELDEERRRFLMQYIDKTDLQVFITSTVDPGIGNLAEKGPLGPRELAAKKFVVEDGKVKPVEWIS